VEKEDRTKILHPRDNILYTTLPVTLFSINCNKTHKLQLKYEQKLNTICTNFYKKTYSLDLWGILSFLETYKSRLFKAIF